MSHFDALLDFEDQPVTNGTSKHNDMSDFDPFGSTAPMEPKGGAGTDLLVDFSGNSEVVTNGSTEEGNILQLDISTSNDIDKPLFDLSSPDKKTLNEPVSPLYDLTSKPDILSPQKETKNSDIFFDDPVNGGVEPLCDFSEDSKTEEKMEVVTNSESTDLVDITPSTVLVTKDSKNLDDFENSAIQEVDIHEKDMNGDAQNEMSVNSDDVEGIKGSDDVVLEENEQRKEEIISVDNSEASFEQNYEQSHEQTSPQTINDEADKIVECKEMISEEHEDFQQKESVLHQDNTIQIESESEVVPAQELRNEDHDAEEKLLEKEVDVQQAVPNAEMSMQDENKQEERLEEERRRQEQEEKEERQRQEEERRQGEEEERRRREEEQRQREEEEWRQAEEEEHRRQERLEEERRRQEQEEEEERQRQEEERRQREEAERRRREEERRQREEEERHQAEEEQRRMEELEIKKVSKAKRREEPSSTESPSGTQPSPKGAAMKGSHTDAHAVNQDMSSGMISLEQQNGEQTENLQGGVYDNDEPKLSIDVVKSVDLSQEPLPEHGTTKNIKDRFQQLASGTSPRSGGKREITPDRSGRVEFVSEPRGVFETYEGKAESGVFESQPVINPDVVRHGEGDSRIVDVPEKGLAKNLAAKYTDISSGSQTGGTPRAKREITPDRSGRVEYVSEPRGTVEHYEGKAEAGVFESQPVYDPTVVRAAEVYHKDKLPEKGFAKSVVSRFREGAEEKKEVRSVPRPITPPRGEAVVYESQPAIPEDVVRAEDYIQETLPEQGLAKNLLSKFKELESGSGKDTERNKKEFTPPREDPRIQPRTGECGVYENEPEVFKGFKNKMEHGVRENQPDVREDVARESDYTSFDQGIPEQGSTRNLLSKWKQVEVSSGSPSASHTPTRRKDFTPPRDEPILSPKSPAHGGQSVHPNDLPGQYHEQVRAGVSENQPQHLQGVAREKDTDWSAGMPREGCAKNVLARFKKFQTEIQQSPQHPSSNKKESVQKIQYEPALKTHQTPPSKQQKVKPKGGGFTPVQLDRCAACQKVVYAMEKLEVNKAVYHKACFKCSHCKAVLKPTNFSLNNGVMFCTPHFKQLFARKGNYDEGFGRQQYKKKWLSEPNLADNTQDGHLSDSNA